MSIVQPANPVQASRVGRRAGECKGHLAVSVDAPLVMKPLVAPRVAGGAHSAACVKEPVSVEPDCSSTNVPAQLLKKAPVGTDTAGRSWYPLLVRKHLGFQSRPESARATPALKNATADSATDLCRRTDSLDGTNGRCPARGFLEFHHVVPFADGGAADAAISRCAAARTTRRGRRVVRTRRAGGHGHESLLGPDLVRRPSDRPATASASKESAGGGNRTHTGLVGPSDFKSDASANSATPAQSRSLVFHDRGLRITAANEVGRSNRFVVPPGSGSRIAIVLMLMCPSAVNAIVLCNVCWRWLGHHARRCHLQRAMDHDDELIAVPGRARHARHRGGEPAVWRGASGARRFGPDCVYRVRAVELVNHGTARVETQCRGIL